MKWEQPGPWHDVGPCELVYGVNAADQLVLAPMDRALELAALRELLLSARTWGEFMSSLSPERYAEVLEGFDDDLPPSSEPFDQDAVPGVADCDWPDPPAERMTEWIPADIGERYGQLVNTTFSGVIAQFDTTAAPSVTAELESRGFRCVRNDVLVDAM